MQTCLQVVDFVILPFPEIPALLTIWYTLNAVTVDFETWVLQRQGSKLQNSCQQQSSTRMRRRFNTTNDTQCPNHSRTTNVALALLVSTAAALISVAL